MKIKKNTFKIILIVLLLLASAGLLYYYFFVNIGIDKGENIDWKNTDYDEDFYPVDSTEVYGEYGEWRIKEFRPVYAGYGTTDKGLNYLIGKYLDGNDKEQTVDILVSGDGMPEWMFPDDSFLEFYNSYYREGIAIRGNSDPAPVYEFDNLTYSADDEFLPLSDKDLYSCPEELVMTTDQVNAYVSIADELPGYSFVKQDYYYEYCNPYNMFYNDYPSKIIVSFEDLIEKLKIGDQFSVRYLESSKTFEECRYDYDDYQKILCANEYLNEMYEDEFLVGIYVVLD